MAGPGVVLIRLDRGARTARKDAAFRAEDLMSQVLDFSNRCGRAGKFDKKVAIDCRNCVDPMVFHRSFCPPLLEYASG
ncbi:hypothetical protein ACLF3G_18445 [Falsiroseomonas sp. HC035]|uniref:hypothetical protein n=1 Tax=Falsiroseomonas sp. HC035 TaxID=3390999 RepID=UPI003D31613E